MKKIPTLLLTLAFTAGFASTAAYAEAPANDDAFARMDLNKDGKVSAMEFGADVRKKFKELDTDKDGSLGASELAAAGPVQKKLAKAEKSGAAKVKLADADKDGALSAEEVVAYSRQLFDMMDKSKDGLLTKEELDKGDGVMKKSPV